MGNDATIAIHLLLLALVTIIVGALALRTKKR